MTTSDKKRFLRLHQLMNADEKINEISKDFNYWNKFGVYFISERGALANTDEQFMVKIGSASLSQLGQRVNRYFFCFPSGFSVHALITVKDPEEAREVEKICHSIFYSTRLQKKKLKKHGHVKEWFYLDKKTLDNLFFRALIWLWHVKEIRRIDQVIYSRTGTFFQRSHWTIPQATTIKARINKKRDEEIEIMLQNQSVPLIKAKRLEY